jgi:flagellar biosynthesis/type III secretory pathway M-ring protein FliF/YscJ
MMLDSIFLWEALTFVVLMSVLFILYPKIRRRKRRSRDLMQGSDGRYEGAGSSREEYLEIRDEIEKTTEDQNAR